MFISDFAIKRPLITVVAMLTLVGFGLVALSQLQTDEFPEVQPPIVLTTIIYPGASPEQVEREVLEETGVTARVIDVVGFRHAAGAPERPVSNIYVVFRLEAIEGEPRPDNIETFDAGFYTVEEAAAIPGMSVESLWFVRTAVAAAGRTGFTYEAPADLVQRPRRRLFGLRLGDLD